MLTKEVGDSGGDDEGGGWRVEGGGWRVEGGVWRVLELWCNSALCECVDFYINHCIVLFVINY